MTKEFVCIVCPNSCRLTVTEKNGQLEVTGNTCKRGLEHGISEFTNPTRMITSTVKIKCGTLTRLPVISTAEVPKSKLKDCLDTLYTLQVDAPVKCGDLLMENICGTGSDIVASRSMRKKELT